MLVKTGLIVNSTFVPSELNEIVLISLCISLTRFHTLSNWLVDVANNIRKSV